MAPASLCFTALSGLNHNLAGFHAGGGVLIHQQQARLRRRSAVIRTSEERIGRVVTYLHSHYQEELDIERLRQIAASMGCPSKASVRPMLKTSLDPSNWRPS